MSEKLNKQSMDQMYLFDRKLYGAMKHRDEDRNNATPNPLTESINVYGEYRKISTTTKDRDNAKFRKDLQLPEGMYQNGAMPAIFVRSGHAEDAIKNVHPVVYNPGNRNYTIKTFSLTENLFDGDMDYFFNILSIGFTDTTTHGESFLPVYWGDETEKLQLSSLALNQVAENTDFVYHKAVDGTIRNIDHQTKKLDPFVKYLNNEIALFAQYEEFSPGDNLFDKNDAADADEPKQFTLSFDFPKQLFNPRIQPVVIYNLGAKVIADPGTEIRKLTGFLKTVDADGFKVTIREWSPNQNFATTDVYFCSYVALGEMNIDTDERIQKSIPKEFS